MLSLLHKNSKDGTPPYYDSEVRVVDDVLYVRGGSGGGYAGAQRWYVKGPDGVVVRDPTHGDEVTSFATGPMGHAQLDRKRGLIFVSRQGVESLVKVPSTHVYAIYTCGDHFLVTCPDSVYHFDTNSSVLRELICVNNPIFSSKNQHVLLLSALVSGKKDDPIIINSTCGFPVLLEGIGNRPRRWDEGLKGDTSGCRLAEGGNGEYFLASNAGIYRSDSIGSKWSRLLGPIDYTNLIRDLEWTECGLIYTDDTGIILLHADGRNSASQTLVKTNKKSIYTSLAFLDGYLYVGMSRLMKGVFFGRLPLTGSQSPGTPEVLQFLDINGSFLPEDAIPSDPNVDQGYETMPSGKVVLKNFDDDGVLIKEQHSYGLLNIGISIRYHDGKIVDETYFHKKAMVGRKTYERARKRFPDMPAASAEVKDVGAQLLAAVKQEQKMYKAQRQTHRPDPISASKGDEFCQSIMKDGKSADGLRWIKDSHHTLGELSPDQSRSLVRKLDALGCRNISICKIDDYGYYENSDHIVAELPDNESIRAKIFEYQHKHAQTSGHDGDFDNGQKMIFFWFD